MRVRRDQNDRELRLPERLLRWYAAERREMPWRDHPDPYAVWVSEIMLQQTQVSTVGGYFNRFLVQFPSLTRLAAASEQAVLKSWEGLGYYSRARNLRKAAQRIVAQGGQMPVTVEDWATLPGVGPYTAAAITSICFGVYAPVVDGNVIRVFSRFLGWHDDFRKTVARRKLAAWLQPQIDQVASPGDFNQAMMDLGATVCSPRDPKCAQCPLRDDCFARREAVQNDFPVKATHRPLPTRHALAVRICRRAGRFLFVQRPSSGLLGGLWELPGGMVPCPPTDLELPHLLQEQTGLDLREIIFLGSIPHAFTHFKLMLHVYRATLPQGRIAKRTVENMRVAKASQLPLTTVTHRALEL